MIATQKGIDYKQLLSRLCHLVALSETNKIENVIDSLLISVVEIDPRHPATDNNRMDEALRIYFGVQLDAKDLASAIERLVQSGNLIRNSGTDSFALSPGARATQMHRVDAATRLETEVRRQWIDSIRGQFQAWSETVEAELWLCLKCYLTKLFRRHGAQTALVASGQCLADAELDKSTGDMLSAAISDECKTIDPKLARTAVQRFLQEQTPERSTYIAQLLDGTFSFYALFTDEATQGYLKQALPRLTVFLDTNFLFGVLNLHNNPQNEVSVELVSLVREQKLPFELYYHEDSLLEMRDVLEAIEKQLARHVWSQALSRAVLHTRATELSGIELKYHESNAKHLMDVSAFFMKFRHVEKLLTAQGFKIYRRPDKQDEVLDERTRELIAKYEKFLEDRFPHRRSKPFNTIKHDIILWRAAKALRKAATSGLDVGALLLSEDQRLFAFDWGVLNTDHNLGVVVLPSQLLQLLRPFIPRTPDFDRRFAEVFALPEFRSGGSDFSQVTRRVLSFLTTVKDLKEETATAILADELLLRRLKSVEAEDDIKAVIESEILKKNAVLEKKYAEASAQLRKAQAEADEKRIKLAEQEREIDAREQLLREQAVALERERQEKLRNKENSALASEEVAQVRKKIDDVLKEKHQVQVVFEKTNEELSDLRSRLAAMESSHARSSKVWRGVSVALVTFSAWLVFGVVLLYKKWQWLENHGHKLGLALAIFILAPAFSWLFFGWRYNGLASGRASKKPPAGSV